MSRLTNARRLWRMLRTSCTQARLTDRELMSMRTDLGRHAGWGCGPVQT